jgi:hypoxanthine phosphoribosyltransferase
MYTHLQEVLYHESTIRVRLDEMARELTHHYAGRPLTVVAVLHGSLFFAVDLLRRLSFPLRLTTVEASSYHGQTASSGAVNLQSVNWDALTGQDVLIIDDILDTGRTLGAVIEQIRTTSQPLSVRTAVLLSKRKKRTYVLEADFCAFHIDDQFVVGYGLDYFGHYRHLPMIGTLREEFIMNS